MRAQPFSFLATFLSLSAPLSVQARPNPRLLSSFVFTGPLETLPRRLAIYSRYLYAGIYEQIIIGGMFRHFSAKLLLFILRYPADREIQRSWPALINSVIRADAPGENVFITPSSLSARAQPISQVDARALLNFAPTKHRPRLAKRS